MDLKKIHDLPLGTVLQDGHELPVSTGSGAGDVKRFSMAIIKAWVIAFVTPLYDGITQGPAGPAGSPGSQGIQGQKGDKGDRGDKGDTGIKGDIGPVGAVGIQGPNGVKGDKGDKGDQGTQGIQGAAGAQGDPGPGVPTGGATNQILSKVSGESYDTAWSDQPDVTGKADKTYVDGADAVLQALINSLAAELPAYQATSERDTDGGYLGRDSFGNAYLPGKFGIGTNNPSALASYLDVKLGIEGGGGGFGGRTALAIKNTSSNSGANLLLINSDGNILGAEISGPDELGTGYGAVADFYVTGADLGFFTDADVPTGGTHSIKLLQGGYAALPQFEIDGDQNVHMGHHGSTRINVGFTKSAFLALSPDYLLAVNGEAHATHLVVPDEDTALLYKINVKSGAINIALA